MNLDKNDAIMIIQKFTAISACAQQQIDHARTPKSREISFCVSLLQQYVHDAATMISELYSKNKATGADQFTIIQRMRVKAEELSAAVGEVVYGENRVECFETYENMKKIVEQMITLYEDKVDVVFSIS